MTRKLLFDRVNQQVVFDLEFLRHLLAEIILITVNII